MDPASGRTLEAGRTLGHYRLLERIGAGGMGEVWRARDERLERDVALKVLLPGMIADAAARKRFRREALALSKLSHPGIATVFDFDTEDGHDFLVMEYVGGATIGAHRGEGTHSETEVVRLGLQLAEGLAAAHAEGIVHRDLKPANVRLTADGRLKILDFGLAHLARPAGDGAGSAAPTQSASMTEAGALVGTLGYMAPEQVRGEKADARADLWAAGLVLYELATGRAAYAHAETAPLLHAILNESVVLPRKANPRLSPALEAIILKCVEKEAAKRYGSARELGADLQRLQGGLSVAAERARTHAQRLRTLAVAGPIAVVLVLVALTALDVGGLRTRLFAPSPIRSIAVLPLANLSGDPEQEYFADGMTEQLINDLGQVGSLRIISRTSTMQYKGTKKGLKEIARELGVDGIVEGSVVRSGDRVKITAQLIRAAEDRQLWANSFERELRDVLVMQGEIAQAIVGAVKAVVTPEQATRLANVKPVDPEAQEFYLRGRYYLNQLTEAGVRTAIDYFERAVAKDPGMASAHAAIAEAYGWLGAVGLEAMDPRDANERIRVSVREALELDPDLATAHLMLAGLYVDTDRDYDAAEREYKRAIELNPNNGTALIIYAQFLECFRHDFVRPVELAKRAVEVEPATPFVHANLVFRYYFARRYDEALAESRRALKLEPNFWITHWGLGVMLSKLGRHDQAVAEVRRALELSPGNPYVKSALGFALARQGNAREARAILADLQRPSGGGRVAPFCVAEVFEGLGQRDSAIVWIMRAEDEGVGVGGMMVDPRWSDLRTDPRVRELLRRQGLPTYE
jgi:serine/threonine-protein kinase